MSLSSYLQALDGVDINDRSSLTRDVISLNVAFISLVTVVTVIRMSIRIWMVHAVGLDDYLMLLAAIFTVILCSFGLVGTYFGLGTHIWLLSSTLPDFFHKTMRITQSLYVCYLAYATAITLTKCSIIVSYLRIFPNPSLRRLVLSTGTLVILMWICSVFVLVFECIPIQAAWDWTAKGKCVNILVFFYVGSSINIATDIILWIAPLPLFWKMNLGQRERILICVLFSFGFFACIASILRLSQLHGLHSIDITYTSVASVNWSVAEVSTAILCACIPSMRPLAAAILPKSWLTSNPSFNASNTATARARQGSSAFELAESAVRSGRSRYEIDKEEGDWEQLPEDSDTLVGGRRDNLLETVDLKEMLREDRIGIEDGSPPQTPGANKVVGTNEKL